MPIISTFAGASLKRFGLTTAAGGKPITVELLVVAGGGSGNSAYAINPGSYARSGGGGGGGYIYKSAFTLFTKTIYTIQVGGANTDSYIGTTLTAVAGGYGGAGLSYPGTGSPGGSGGGAGAWSSPFFGPFPFPISGGTGTQPTQPGASGSPDGKGNPGGTNNGGAYSAGGGGGAGGTGPSNSGYNQYVPGAPGLSNSITGTAVTYAAGGNSSLDVNGANGGANTGAGGDGVKSVTDQQTTPGSGGSGIVVIKYADSIAAATTTGTVTYTVSGGFRTYKFTGSGTIEFV